MTRRGRVTLSKGFYHVYSRGVDKRQIFLDEEDFNKFLTLTEISFFKKNFFIYAFCLMTNHYHLMIETTSDNLSSIMHEINFKYAKYFNEKYDRKGVLFESRFKSIIINKDHYALQLLKYIHLNPVKARLVTNPENWNWSSYRYYSRFKDLSFLNKDLVQSYFKQNTISRFIKFHEIEDEFHYIIV